MMEKIDTADRDYRIQDIRMLTEDLIGSQGVLRKAGTIVTVAGLVQFDSHIISFSLPNMTALLLDQSYTSWKTSQHFLQNDERFLNFSKEPGSSETIHITSENESFFFDLLQKRMIAIVFAYTALESFANESIPEQYTFRRDNRKKFTEEYTKQQAEGLPLDTKLYEILPSIFKTNTIKGTSIGQKFATIEKVRDRIIHMKSKDRIIINPKEDTIWKELLNITRRNVALDVKEIIGYYFKSLDEKPRWFREFPWTN